MCPLTTNTAHRITHWNEERLDLSPGAFLLVFGQSDSNGGDHVTRLKMLKTRVKPFNLEIAKPASRAIVSLYSSKEWLGLMSNLKRLRGNRCQHCNRSNCKIFGDHIVELSDGGAPLDPANVQLLCGSCHTIKTNAERAKRMAKPLRP